MFAELRHKAATALVRIVGNTCLLLGGTLVLIAMLAILTPLLLGLALLAMAGEVNMAQTPHSHATVVTVG